jgi:hypothetical protein
MAVRKRDEFQHTTPVTLLHFFTESRHGSLSVSPENGPTEARHELLRSCLMTTTLIGFGVLTTAHVDVLRRNLGNLRAS